MRFATPALVFLLLCSSATAQQQVVLDSNQDTSIYEESGTVSNGAGSYLFAGTNGRDNQRRALVQFDLSSIPANATVTGASLTLHMSKTIAANQPVGVHRVLESWGEGSSDASLNEGTGAAAMSGDATWTHRIFNTTRWTTAGGDYEPTASASIPVGGIATYEWSSAGTVSDVQGWIDGSLDNNGWILIGSTATSTAKRFDSRENVTAVFRPALTVTYTTGTSVEDTPAQAEPTLAQNYPNPFRSGTAVTFAVPVASDVTLQVFDLLGRRVATLVEGTIAAGVHSVWFQPGREPAGIYLARLRVGDRVITRQMARIE